MVNLKALIMSNSLSNSEPYTSTLPIQFVYQHNIQSLIIPVNTINTS